MEHENVVEALLEVFTEMHVQRDDETDSTILSKAATDLKWVLETVSLGESDEDEIKGWIDRLNELSNDCYTGREKDRLRERISTFLDMYGNNLVPVRLM